jgi:hypothetical protein
MMADGREKGAEGKERKGIAKDCEGRVKKFVWYK